MRNHCEACEQARLRVRKAATVVGITGGIASGKTVATDALIASGFCVIDADEISRAITAPHSPAERALISQFPDACADGRLDRRRLREIISTDAAARARLNAVTHPLILSEIARQISNANGDVVLSAPLLFETGLDKLCDATVCVTCPYELRLKRLVERDGVTEKAAAAMIAAQMPDAERNAKANFTISSDRPRREFERDAIALFADLFADLRNPNV